MLPRFEIEHRRRPVELVATLGRVLDDAHAGTHALPVPAPYLAAGAPLTRRAELSLSLGGSVLTAASDTEYAWLVVDGRRLQSRRHGRCRHPDRLALSLTGTHITAWVRESGRWVARARHDLLGAGADKRPLDVRDEATLAAATITSSVDGLVAGGFGRLGVRDVRVVSRADGQPWRGEGSWWLSVTAAGPGFFDTAHTSILRLDPVSWEVEHSADLFFRRPDAPGVYGDHATHVVRHGERWLVATSTWGNFTRPRNRSRRRTPSTLRVTLADTDADVLHGTHVLDTRELPLPTDGLSSLAVWDPHLLHRDGHWWVGYVSAHRFFRFQPVLASGRSLAALQLRGAARDRTATEGTTLIELGGEVVVLASDGRDSRRRLRERFPVFDTSMHEIGVLAAPYPTNIPWPSLVRDGDHWLMFTFNGRGYGGPLLGYGTHGDLVVMRTR